MERTRWLVRRKQWEITRQQGWFGFVVLRKAIPMWAAGMLGVAFASHLFHHNLRLALVNAAWMVLAAIIVGAVGTVEWLANERRFHQSPSSPQDTPQ